MAAFAYVPPEGVGNARMKDMERRAVIEGGRGGVLECQARPPHAYPRLYTEGYAATDFWYTLFDGGGGLDAIYGILEFLFERNFRYACITVERDGIFRFCRILLQ